MESISPIVPNPDDLIGMPTDKAAFLLLSGLQPSVKSQHNHFNCKNESSAWLYGLPQSSPKFNQLTSAFMEAWNWLEYHGLLIHSISDAGNGWYSISRKGLGIKSFDDFSKFQHGQLLSSDLLVAELTNVRMNFLVGDFDTAVFQAFKTVEVSVREAAELPDGEIGVNLMRKAFHPETGLLTDRNQEKGEREAISSLFAGAIGYQKNPHSHRLVGLSDPAEAAELILLANHLLRIVIFRSKEKQKLLRPKRGPHPPPSFR